jgi:hypothetical protein
MEKKRFKIVLNWYGEIHTIWKHAISNAQARALAIKELADNLGREPFSMLAYFNSSKDNILITEA